MEPRLPGRPGAPPPPGAPMWLAYVLVALPLAGMLLAFAVSRVFPDLPESASVAIWAGTPIAFVTAYAVLRGRRARREAGLVPQREGYTATVELLAAKLRERAEALDGALRFGRALDDARELQSFADEVRVPAQRFDRRELMPGLDVRHPHESYLGGGPMPEEAPAALAAHARRLRAAATDLDAYAVELREKGGLFRTKPGEAIGCGIVLFALLGLGIWLLQAALQRGGFSFVGLGLLAAAALGFWALAGTQRGES